MRSGQQAALGSDLIGLLDALGIDRFGQVGSQPEVYAEYGEELGYGDEDVDIPVAGFKLG